MKITLSEISTVFSSRSRAHELLERLSPGETLLLDFREVDMVSPSFLHEILVILNQKGCQLETSNLTPSFELQLNKAKSAFLEAA